MKTPIGPLAGLAWLAAVACAALAALALLGFFESPDGTHGLPVGLLALASLLAFPPLWNFLRSRWLQAARIAVVAVCAYLGLFLLPTKTEVVKFEFPSSSQP
ncbi:MAG: hypothetical protein WDM86_14220 [Rhizomicrobium sp.]